MTAWYWYVARSNEIFVDLDSRRALSRALAVLRRAVTRESKLRQAAGTDRFRLGGDNLRTVHENYPPFENLLSVDSAFVYPSPTKNHVHLIVVLKDSLPIKLRACWALWMGGDQLRAAYVLERARHGLQAVELLTARKPYVDFRPFDDVCGCKEKHKRSSVTEKCEAMNRLLGIHRSADYFPRNKDRKRRAPLKVAWGRLPKRLLMDW